MGTWCKPRLSGRYASGTKQAVCKTVTFGFREFESHPANVTKYNTPEELAAKIEWEGGLYEAIVNYGIEIEDLVNLYQDIQDAFAAYKASALKTAQLEYELEDLLGFE